MRTKAMSSSKQITLRSTFSSAAMHSSSNAGRPLEVAATSRGVAQSISYMKPTQRARRPTGSTLLFVLDVPQLSLLLMLTESQRLVDKPTHINEHSSV